MNTLLYSLNHYDNRLGMVTTCLGGGYTLAVEAADWRCTDNPTGNAVNLDMARSRTWMFSPGTGGANIPPAVRTRVEARIRKYAKEHYAGKFSRLDVRFRGALCYVDAYQEPAEPPEELLKITGETAEECLQRLRNVPIHLCRLRYFGNEEAWGLALFTYSNEKYELSVFRSGEFFGTPEDAFELGASFHLTP